MTLIENLREHIYQYLVDKNLRETFTIGEISGKKLVIYVHKKDALTEFAKKNLKFRYKKYFDQKIVKFIYIGKIRMAS